ncbi:hypothetical protein ACSSS7_007395 [Eimeria intestinalis]
MRGLHVSPLLSPLGSSPLPFHVNHSNLGSGSSIRCLLTVSSSRLRHVPGASRMRWPYQPPTAAASAAASASAAADWREWVRRPVLSPETGEPTDWLHKAPTSGKGILSEYTLEAISVYGPEVVRVEGLPFGKTPEFLQERLSRYFSRFGALRSVHVLPHPRDPYQTCGTAYVGFECREGALKAVRLPIRLPASLHFKVLRLQHVATGRCSDELYIHRKLHANRNILFLARQLYLELVREGSPLSLSCLRRRVFVRAFCGDRSIPHTRGAWLSYSSSNNNNNSSSSSSSNNSSNSSNTGEETAPPASSGGAAARKKQQQEMLLAARLIAPDQLDVLLKRGSRLLHRKLEAELSVHWRQGKPRLPEYGALAAAAVAAASAAAAVVAAAIAVAGAAAFAAAVGAAVAHAALKGASLSLLLLWFQRDEEADRQLASQGAPPRGAADMVSEQRCLQLNCSSSRSNSSSCCSSSSSSEAATLPRLPLGQILLLLLRASLCRRIGDCSSSSNSFRLLCCSRHELASSQHSAAEQQQTAAAARAAAAAATAAAATAAAPEAWKNTAFCGPFLSPMLLKRSSRCF